MTGSDVLDVSSFFLMIFNRMSPRKSCTVNPTTDLESPSKVVRGQTGVSAVAKPKTGFFSVFLTKKENDAHQCRFLNFVLNRNFTNMC